MTLGKVGSKGELFPPKKIREKIGLKKGESILYRVKDGRLIVEKIPSVEELIKKPSKTTITLEEVKENRKQIGKEALK